MARPHSEKAKTVKIFVSHVNAQRESTVEVSNQIDRMTKCSGDISQPLSQPFQCSFNGPMNNAAMGAGMEAIQGFSKQHGLPIAMTVWLILWLDA